MPHTQCGQYAQPTIRPFASGFVPKGFRVQDSPTCWAKCCGVPARADRETVVHLSASQKDVRSCFLGHPWHPFFGLFDRYFAMPCHLQQEQYFRSGSSQLRKHQASRLSFEISANSLPSRSTRCEGAHACARRRLHQRQVEDIQVESLPGQTQGY